MIYEFECSHGHVTEASVPVGTKTWPCAACEAEYEALVASHKTFIHWPAESRLAKRILSPTRTTFVFADTRR